MIILKFHLILLRNLERQNLKGNFLIRLSKPDLNILRLNKKIPVGAGISVLILKLYSSYLMINLEDLESFPLETWIMYTPFSNC